MNSGGTIKFAEAPRDPLLVEREKTHGSFSQNAAIAQRIKDIYRMQKPQWSNLSAEQREALDMIALKIGRAISNPENVDTWDDIAGYAKLGAEACG